MRQSCVAKVVAVSDMAASAASRGLVVVGLFPKKLEELRVAAAQVLHSHARALQPVNRLVDHAPDSPLFLAFDHADNLRSKQEDPGIHQVEEEPERHEPECLFRVDEVVARRQDRLCCIETLVYKACIPDRSNVVLESLH